MTFYGWLKDQKERNDIVGDFARDVIFENKKDKSAVPKGGILSYTKWVKKIHGLAFCPKRGYVWDAFTEAWFEYSSKIDKN